ncbi:MAG: bifunctional tetrahydrofolate synthase/dihydrofolate synthase, partial [Legionella sp.]
TGKVHAVFSALKDKDISGLIEPLKSVVDHWYPAQLDTKRAVSSDKLLLLFQDAELFPELCYNSPHIAFIEAQKRAQLGDLIVVFGSFFTVSQIMAAQHKLLEPKEI